VRTNRWLGIPIVVTLACFVCAIVSAQEPTATATTDSSPKGDTSAPTSTATNTSSSASEKVDTEIDGVTAELVSATRTDGDTVTIKFKFTNGGQKHVEINFTGYSPDNLASKVYYIDSKNKKKYLVVTDAAGTPICSTMKGSTKLNAGESKSGWAKFPAPPAGVTTISVYLPGTPPFEGVTIAAK
jgi:hypothetical protein